MTDLEVVQNMLAKLRARGWTAQAIADASGIPVRTIQHWRTATEQTVVHLFGERCRQLELLLERDPPTPEPSRS